MVPYLAITRHSLDFLAAAFVIDVFVTFVITYFTAVRTKRWDVISAFPYVYVLRWVSLAVFLQSFVEVVLLRKYRTNSGAWENNSTRRYVMESS